MHISFLISKKRELVYAAFSLVCGENRQCICHCSRVALTIIQAVTVSEPQLLQHIAAQKAQRLISFTKVSPSPATRLGS